MDAFDPIIHQPVRLQIMAALCQLGIKQQVDFNFLKTNLSLTDGNLGAHLATLEEKGYVVLEKAFVNRHPKTFVAPTPAGRQAFNAHVAALRAIIASHE